MKTDLLKTTPVEKYNGVFVKREDLCGTNDSPTFSKIRGIVAYLSKLKETGINIVGYTETSISMAGWGIAWACKMLEMKAVIFNPIYSVRYYHSEVLDYHREQWKKFDAELYPIKAGMAKVNWYISKKMLHDIYGDSALLLPLGLPFQETIDATAKEIVCTLKETKKISDFPENIVVNIGSGTICAGIWKGLDQIGFSGTLYGVLGRTSNQSKKRQIIAKKAGILEKGLFGSSVELKLIDPGWEYTQKSEQSCPFPCHAYYDLKAWQWLMENKKELKGTTLFWNIGH